MMNSKWIHTIIRALVRLDGDAPYALLKPEIENSGERELTLRWHQTVEGTVEQFSSDSIRGPKPAGFAGSDKDVFRKIGHGHWGIRDYGNPYVVQALEGIEDSGMIENTFGSNSGPSDEKSVFVREHWRAHPSDREADEAVIELQFKRMMPSQVWVSIQHLHVGFTNGLEIQFPLSWFSMLFALPKGQQADVEVVSEGLLWRNSSYLLTVSDLFYAMGEN